MEKVVGHDQIPIFQVQVRVTKDNLGEKPHFEKVMYSMRPLTTLPPISPQDVVYKMKNIHEEKPVDFHRGRLSELFRAGMMYKQDGREEFNEEYRRLFKVFVSSFCQAAS